MRWIVMMRSNNEVFKNRFRLLINLATLNYCSLNSWINLVIPSLRIQRYLDRLIPLYEEKDPEGLRLLWKNSSFYILSPLIRDKVHFQIIQHYFKDMIYEIIYMQQYNSISCSPKKNGIILDVGANIGIFSIFAAKLMRFKGTIYAFEPEPSNLKTLSLNIKSNNLHNLIASVRAAVSDKSGETMLDTSSSFVAHKIVLPYNDSVKSCIPVNVMTIDDFCLLNNIHEVDFIKMDIEGHELQAIEGALNTIKKYRPRMAIAAYHYPGDRSAIAEKINKIEMRYHIRNYGGIIHAYI